MALLIPAFLQSSKLELAGIPVLINVFIIMGAFPIAIAPVIWPDRVLKKVFNVIASIVFLPIIFIHLFLYIGVPILSNQYEKNITQIIADINGKSFIPIGLDKYNQVILPGNILVRLRLADRVDKDLFGKFMTIFQKEIIQKQKSVTLITSGDPYTITSMADSTDAALNQGEKYRLIEADLGVDGQLIDQNWFEQYKK